MRPVDWGLVLVTDAAAAEGRDLGDLVCAALDGGVRAVVLRARGLAPRAALVLASHALAHASRTGADVIVHDRADLALALGAPGVHLPQDGLPAALVRDLVPPPRLVGVSCHSLAQVVDAERAAADYAFLGPIHETPSKAAYGAPLGVEAIADVRAATALPLIAIGGFDGARAARALRAGADGVAVVRAVLAARDPADAAARLGAMIDGARAEVAR